MGEGEKRAGLEKQVSGALKRRDSRPSIRGVFRCNQNTDAGRDVVIVEIFRHKHACRILAHSIRKV